MNTEGPVVPEEPKQSQDEVATTEPEQNAKDLMIVALAHERDHLKDQLLRAMAEAQNVQRRLRQQAEEDKKFASRSLVEKLLPVVDSFERSLLAAENGASLESLLDGVKVIDKQLRQALDSARVERIVSVGAPYDPEFHEAIVTIETDEHPEDTVTDEIEPGYTMHGRVVRPAKVRVSKKP